MAEKIKKVFLIVLLLLFPLGELGRLTIANDISLTVNDAIVGITVFIWFTNLVLRKKKLAMPLAKPIGIFIGVGILSLLINVKNFSGSELLIGSMYLLRWSLYAGLYFVVREVGIGFKKKIINLMFLIGGIIVLGGYVQYFFYPNLRNLYYAGWDEHLYRMFSSFLDPNFAGAFFVLYLLLIVGMIKEKSIKLGILGAFTTLGIFLTYSRSAYIMLVASILIFLILKKKKQMLFRFIILFALVIVLLSKSLQSEGTNLLRTTSTFARLESAEKALVIFKDHPIFGVGFNTYRYSQYQYGFLRNPPSGEVLVNHAGAGSDNSFLFVLATTGVVGFIAYLILWKSIINNSQKSDEFARMTSIVLYSSAVGLFVNAFFINSLFYPFIMEWMWILIAVNEKS